MTAVQGHFGSGRMVGTSVAAPAREPRLAALAQQGKDGLHGLWVMRASPYGEFKFTNFQACRIFALGETVR